MIVAGIMSGTSADGADVALVEFHGSPLGRRWKLLGFRHQAWGPQRQAAILEAAGGGASLADIARLHFALGRWYGAAAASAIRAFGARPDLIACHGQTVYHEGGVASLQLGDAATLAAATRFPVASNFRAADLAAGGQGAPLVPFADWVWLRHPKRFRVALNLGGIANLTLLPPGCRLEDVIGFDTGPGNMVLDALARRFLQRPRDTAGRLAARGRVIEPLLRRLLGDAYFRRRAPKSAGREQFGAAYAEWLVGMARRASAADIMATAVALTARSVAAALPANAEVVVSGGGARNPVLMRQLKLAAPGRSFISSEDLGIPAQAKESMLVALLGYCLVRKAPANLPRVTGARHAAILGQLTPAPIA